MAFYWKDKKDQVSDYAFKYIFVPFQRGNAALCSEGPAPGRQCVDLQRMDNVLDDIARTSSYSSGI